MQSAMFGSAQEVSRFVGDVASFFGTDRSASQPKLAARGLASAELPFDWFFSGALFDWLHHRRKGGFRCCPVEPDPVLHYQALLGFVPIVDVGDAWEPSEVLNLFWRAPEDRVADAVGVTASVIAVLGSTQRWGVLAMRELDVCVVASVDERDLPSKAWLDQWRAQQ
jgi:hypothetical protein